MQNSTLPVPTIEPADHASLLIPINCTQPATASLPMDHRPPPPHQSWDLRIAPHNQSQSCLCCGEKLSRRTSHVRAREELGSRPPAHPPLSCPTFSLADLDGYSPIPSAPFPHEVLLGLVGRTLKPANTCHVSLFTRRLGSKSDHKPLVTSSFSKVFSHTHPQRLNCLSPHLTWGEFSSAEVLYSACRPLSGLLERPLRRPPRLDIFVHDSKTATASQSGQHPTTSLRPEDVAKHPDITTLTSLDLDSSTVGTLLFQYTGSNPACARSCVGWTQVWLYTFFPVPTTPSTPRSRDLGA